MSSICSISRKEMMKNVQRYFHKDHFTMTNLYGGLARPPHTKRILMYILHWTNKAKQTRWLPPWHGQYWNNDHLGFSPVYWYQTKKKSLFSLLSKN